jgi:MFS family permease
MSSSGSKTGVGHAFPGWFRVAVAMFVVGWGAQQFAPMLLLYRSHLGVSPGTAAALFGSYAVGLIPGLLLGGAASDRRGRRPLTRLFVALSPLATLILIAGSGSVELLALGRVLAGVCSGVVFSVGSAWVQELSTGRGPGSAARRATIALSAGFGTGPLVAGAIAEWSSGELWMPYIPHLGLGLVALVAVWRVPETVVGRSRRVVGSRVPGTIRSPRFRAVIVPMAPWVFGFASISCVVLPTQLAYGGHLAVVFDGLANAITLGTGVVIQPFAKARENRRRLSASGAGFAFGILALAVALAPVLLTSAPLVLVAAVPFGAAYGALLVSGLSETERLASPEEKGASVAVYLALTCLGFALPFIASALAARIGLPATVGLTAFAAAACAGSVRAGLRRNVAQASTRAASPQRASL